MASQLTVDSTIFVSSPARVARRAMRVPSFAPVRVTLVAALLAAPLAFGAVQAWAWGTLAVVAWLLFFLWALACARRGSVRVFWSPLYLPAGFFFLVGVTQFAARVTIDPTATREALVKLSTCLLLFVLAGQIFSEGVSPGSQVPERAPRDGWGRVGTARGDFLSSAPLRWTLIAYTFFLGLFAIFQFFSSQGLIYWRVPSPGWTFGPYVNHNHYAGLMEMLIPLAIAAALVAFRQDGAPGRSPAGGALKGGATSVRAARMRGATIPPGRHPAALVLGFVLLIPIASLLLSASRGGFIALLAEALLAVVAIFACGPRPARPVFALLAGATLLASGLLFGWMAPRHVIQRLVRMGDGTHPPEVEFRARLTAARDALGILRDHPGLGSGLGSFEAAFPRHMSFATDLRWDHAHNDYAELLAETGLAGGAALACALVMFFGLAFRNLRARLRHPAGWMQFAAALGCCGILVHSFADFNLHIPANAAWFAACAAIATKSHHRDTEAQRQET